MRPSGHGGVSSTPDSNGGQTDSEGARGSGDWGGRAAQLARGEGARRGCAASQQVHGRGRGRTDERLCGFGRRADKPMREWGFFFQERCDPLV
jgi:hypothetical protein